MLSFAATLVVTLLTPPEICSRGTGPLRSVDLPGGVRISGAGSTTQGDTTWLGWTGA
jgi:hypothetical protein